MLEKVPAAIGRTFDGIRAGMNNIVSFDERFAHVPEGMSVTSSAFKKGWPIPSR
jgi:hypothetical protein